MVTEILRPSTVREALRMRKRPGSAFLGGGTWLNSRFAEPPLTLISLEHLGLGQIERTGSSCRIGAMATFQQALDAPELPQAIRKAVSLTASRTLRNMATIGGEIGLRAADSALIPVLIAMDARVEVAGLKNPMPVEAWRGHDRDSLVLAVRLPDTGLPCGVEALSRTSHGPRSLVVAVSARVPGPSLAGLRIVASDCRGQCSRLEGAEVTLSGRPLPPKERIEEIIGPLYSPAADIHASAEYKRYMMGVLIADILHELGQVGAAP